MTTAAPEQFQAVGRATRSVGPTIATGAGATVTDVEGRQYVDFTGGGGSMVIGHCHPVLVEAVRRQIGTLAHTDYFLAGHPLYGRLAELLGDALPWPSQSAFFTSGGEAVENAVKVARAVTGRPLVVAFEGSWHGRGFLSLALSHGGGPHKDPFGPYPEAVAHLPFPGGVDAQPAVLAALADLLAAGEVAAVLAEPIQGDGGIQLSPPGFLDSIAELCHRHGTLLVVDEIQTGYGRTGTFLASSQLMSARPDIVVLGKPMGGGLPVSAIACTSPYLDELASDAIGGTFPGNPVGCAAAIAVLEVMRQEQLCAAAAALGRTLTNRWQAMADDHPGLIADVRGLGSYLGTELAGSELPGSELAGIEQAGAEFRQGLLGHGVLTSWVGPHESVARHLMPLNITTAELDRWEDGWRRSLARAARTGLR